MMNLNALKIDPEFQGKIPPLNAEEEHILEQNMIQERRLLKPLIIWNGYILDGHSRYRIHRRQKGSGTGRPCKNEVQPADAASCAAHP